MRYRLLLLTAGFLALAAGDAGPADAQVGSPMATKPAPAPQALAAAGLHLLDVPFVPQSPALCGGAALAMVLRFWGAPGVHAQDFSSLVGADGAGISASDLKRAVHERGWRALSFGGGLVEARLQLQRGRPIVALLRQGDGNNHYVVLVGVDDDHVLLHDPARGPFRIVEATQLQEAWRDAGGWGLLILPPDDGRTDVPSGAGTGGALEIGSNRDAPPTALDGCALLVERGVRLARNGELEAAGQLLETALGLCPSTPAPLRELAGVRFRQKRWGEAEQLARLAARMQPQDAYTWELLAATCFVQGDLAAALEAWNQVHKPRVDLTRIDGLERTRYDVVTQLLDQPTGTLLTEASLRRSRRRLASLPSRQIAHIEYQPLPDGSAQVNVNVLERPRWNAGADVLPVAAIRTLVDRTLRLEIAAPTGNGELWSASWRWWQNRPALNLRLDMPAAWSTLGIWHVAGGWERQLYRVPDAGTPLVVPVERRRSAVGCGQWATADWHWEVAGALERWSGRGQDAALEIGLERRAAGDRLALRGEAARAWNTGGYAPYATASVLASWRSSAVTERRTLRLRCHAGVAAASSSAPLLLWPGAGTGPGGAYLLRAHPLLDDGVIAGKGFARELAHGGIEIQLWPWSSSLLSLGIAAFVDAARPGSPFARATAPMQVDFGTGLRVQLPTQSEHLRLDVARGARDGQVALSIEIESDRLFHD